MITQQAAPRHDSELGRSPEESGLVLALDSSAASAPRAAGAKGARLARLIAEGAPVPNGFVVTVDAARAFRDANGLGAESAAAEILEGRVPPELAEAVRRGLARLGTAPVAVRSSAVGEDGAEHSFAGITSRF